MNTVNDELRGGPGVSSPVDAGLTGDGEDCDVGFGLEVGEDTGVGSAVTVDEELQGRYRIVRGLNV